MAHGSFVRINRAFRALFGVNSQKQTRMSYLGLVMAHNPAHDLFSIGDFLCRWVSFTRTTPHPSVHLWYSL